MYRFNLNSSTMGGHIPGWYAPRMASTAEITNKCAYRYFNLPIHAQSIFAMCLHNQYKHLENVTVMIYTKYVVLLTQLCMDACFILHRA